MKTVAIYTRVSTAGQAEDGYSISEQDKRLRMFAQAHGWTIVSTYSDPGYSGGKLERPAIQRLIKDAQHHLFSAVLIYKLDRLSRSQKDTLYLIEDVFNPNGVGLISMMENFDTQTAFGKAMIGILSVFAQLERGQITERMTMGRIGRAQAGYYSGGSKPPIGYTYEAGNGKDRHTLVVNDYEAVQVKEIFNLFLHENYTLRGITKYMQEHYTTRYGDWQYVTTVSRILRDRTYIGEVSFSGKYYPGIHKPIISKEEFDAVQVKLDQYLKTGAGRVGERFKGAHLLTGLLYCGQCGNKYFYRVRQKTRKDGSISKYTKYMCYVASGNNKLRTASQVCDNPPVQSDLLEARVIDEIRKLCADPSLVQDISSGHSSLEREQAEERVSALQRRIDELTRQEEKLVDLYQIGTIDLEMVRKRADTIKEERDKLTSEIDAIQKASAPTLPVAEAISQLSAFDAVFRDGTIDEKRAFLRSLIDRIVIFPDRIEIHWAFEAK